MSNTPQQPKRDLSPDINEKTPKKSRIDTLFDSQASEEDIHDLSIGADYFLNMESPMIELQERRPSYFDRARPFLSLENQLTNNDDDDDEDNLLNSLPVRRSLYSELLLSSNAEPEQLKTNTNIFDDDDDDDIESKTTLPLSRSYARPIPNYEDEVDAFFSSHNPANEPEEFVLSSSIKYELLRQERELGPLWRTYEPHFLTQAYFDNHSIKDRTMIVERKEGVDENSITLLDRQFTVTGKMGSGEFSEVYKAHCSETDEDYAIKKGKVSFVGWEDRWLKIVEVDHLRQIQHSKYCVHLVNAWEEQAFLYIQLELCPNGSLDDFIKFKKGNIEEDTVWNLFYEIVLGIKDIHDANIVHLDLKPSNILIDEAGCIKISDFGISVKTPVDLRFLKGEGDRRYMAPDLLREDFNKPADIYSLGLILLELSTGLSLPGKGEPWEMIRLGDFSNLKAPLSKLSVTMSNMIAWLLTTAARNRPSIDDIIGHSTFKTIQDKYQEYSLSDQIQDLPPIQTNILGQLNRQDSFSTVDEVF